MGSQEKASLSIAFARRESSAGFDQSNGASRPDARWQPGSIRRRGSDYVAEVNRRANRIVEAFNTKVSNEVARLSATGASVDPVAVTKGLSKTEFGRELTSGSVSS